MPTAAEVDDFQQAADDIQTLAIAALVSEFAPEGDDESAAVDGARALMLDIVDRFVPAGAAIAADFYDSVRPAGSPSFTAAPVVRPDIIGGGTLGWSTQPLTDPDLDVQQQIDESIARMAAAIEKAAFDAMVETIGEASEEDPLDDVKFARFPQSADPCAYCVLRASRGAVYWSEATATKGDHRDCRCKVTPVFPGEPLPYLRAPYMAQYLNGAEQAKDALAEIRADESLSPRARREREFKALLAGMRAANGIR